MPFYAVRRGKTPGIYKSWTEAEANVLRFPNALHKKFSTMELAERYMAADPPSPPPTAATSRKHSRSPSPSLQSNESSSKRTKTKSAPILLATSSAVPPNPLVCYTDGACRGNGRRFARSTNGGAGAGVYWGVGDKHNQSEPLPLPHTNNRAELLALINAIRSIPKEADPTQHVIIYTDSQYCIDCVTKWIPSWKRKGWMTSAGTAVKNKEMIVLLSTLLQYNTVVNQRKITLSHVKGHSGIAGNVAADMLACAAADASSLTNLAEEDWMRSAAELVREINGN